MGAIFDRYYYPIDVYRKAGDKVQANWGNGDTSEPSGSEAPFLVGYKKTHEIMGLVAPRATDDTQRSPITSRTNEDGKTLFCELGSDIQSEDVIHYIDDFGDAQIYKIQGDTKQDYISPFTGEEGGKEIHIQRFTKSRF